MPRNPSFFGSGRRRRRPPTLGLLCAAALAVNCAGAASAAAAPSSSYYFYACLPTYQFLKALGAKGDLWNADEAGCCGYSESEAGLWERSISCNERGDVVSIVWQGDVLAGDLSQAPLIVPGNSLKLAELDLSDNPRVVGQFPRWLSAMSSLERLSLARTGIEGQLPRLDLGWPHMASLDLSETHLTGYLPILPATIMDCAMALETMCYFRDATWTNLNPGACFDGLPQCRGTPPNLAAPPPLPAVLEPHVSNLFPPGTPYIKPVLEQCLALKKWLLFHGEDELKLWKDSEPCCSFRTGSLVPDREIKCSDWGIYYVLWQPKDLVLVGDIEEPPNTMSQLKALRHVNLGNQRLSGGFPIWATELSDLFSLSLENNTLSGALPSMTRLSYFSSIRIAWNNFSGPLPQMQVRKSPFGGPETGYQHCELGPGNGGLCWEYENIYYDAVCVTSNPQIRPCSGGADLPTASTPEIISSSYICIRSCRDLGRYVAVRLVSGGRIQCAGSNSTSCSWYQDDECRELANGEVAPLLDQGAVCAQVGDGWCAVASSVLQSGQAISQDCPAFGTWYCMRSCTDQGNYALVRAVGNITTGGTVQCQGPDPSSCSWYTDPRCSFLVDGQPEADASRNIGYYCNQLDFGWCKAAADLVFSNRGSMMCGASNATTTVSAHSTPIFPAPPLVAPNVPAGTAVRLFPPSAFLQIRFQGFSFFCTGKGGCVADFSDNGGLYLAHCTMATTENGPCGVIMLRSATQDGLCLAVERITGSVLEVSCNPGRDSRLQVRDAAALLPYWTAFTAGKGDKRPKTKILNADFEPDSGCLQLSPRSGSPLVIGPCNDTDTFVDIKVTPPNATVSPLAADSSSPSIGMGVIVGSVVGGVVALAVIAFAVAFLYRRLQQRPGVKDGAELLILNGAKSSTGGASFVGIQTSRGVQPAFVGSNAVAATAPPLPTDEKSVWTIGASSGPPLSGEPSSSMSSAPPVPSAPAAEEAADELKEPILPSVSDTRIIPQSNDPLLASLLKKRALAFAPHKAQHEDELSLAVGDQVLILTSHDDGWGRVRRQGPAGDVSEGMVPLSFLTVLEDGAIEAPSSSL